MKICIFGAGAIGGFIGAHLTRLPDVALSCIARGEHLSAMQRFGLRVEAPGETFTVPVLASHDTRDFGPQEYVFITLKQQQLAGAVDAIRPLLGPHTVILPPTTGIPYWYHYAHAKMPERRLEDLDPGGVLWSSLAPARVLGCVYFVATALVAPGCIRHDGGRPRFPLGEPDGTVSERVRVLSDAMERAGLRAPVENDIRDWLWLKMISSLCWNPTSVLTRASMDEMLADPPTLAVVRRMMDEAFKVAYGSGAEVAGTPDSLIEGARLTGHHKMSMLEDFESGRPLEIAPLADSIRAMAEISGVETPTIDAALALTRLAERARRLSGVGA